MKWTEKELDHYKKKLLDLKREMFQKIAETNHEIQEVEDPKGYSQHQADEASDDFDQSIALKLSEEEQKILRQIDRALEKIAEGSYGVCEVSGKPISKKRLEAIPYALTSIECQEEFEKKEKS